MHGQKKPANKIQDLQSEKIYPIQTKAVRRNLPAGSAVLLFMHAANPKGVNIVVNDIQKNKRFSELKFAKQALFYQ